FSSRRRHTSSKRDWSSDVCSSDLGAGIGLLPDFLASSHPSLVPVLDKEFGYPATFWAVVRQESLRNPAVAAVYQALKEYAAAGKIGRASCRERVQVGVGGGA